jgi:hypothetical protein
VAPDASSIWTSSAVPLVFATWMWMPSAWALTNGVGMSARVPSHAASSSEGTATGLASGVVRDAAEVGEDDG